MANSKRLLILGGTGEATALAARASSLPGLQVITSLAGRTARPNKPQGELRVGGFGGSDGLVRFLDAEHIDLVVDATHPFAARIAHHAAEAARARRPIVKLVRPPWQASEGDRWIEVENAAAAAEALPALSNRIFLTIGRQELGAFRALTDCFFLVRLVESAPQPLPLHAYAVVTGRGPFAVESERGLVRQHGLSALVSKNSGGSSTYAKIVAARELHLPVIMLRRPPLPDVEQATDVGAVMSWIAEQLT